MKIIVPFYVDYTPLQPPVAAHTPREGRYLVLGSGVSSGAIGTEMFLASQREEPHQIFWLSTTDCQFVGFLGDCVLCDHTRQPEKPE
jgi:hypothetical protein